MIFSGGLKNKVRLYKRLCIWSVDGNRLIPDLRLSQTRQRRPRSLFSLSRSQLEIEGKHDRRFRQRVMFCLAYKAD